MWRALACAVTLVLAAPAASAQESPRHARELFNDGQIDEAIDEATAVWEETRSDEAALVLARARLERYRLFEREDDLAVARRLLDRIDASELTPREALDWELGVAASLFFGGREGPASVIFERLLDDPGLDGEERDRVLDWWASSVDRLGQRYTLDRRVPIYRRMVERLEAELVHQPVSATVSYWAVVASRGADDPERAWDLAVAAWARASLAGEKGDRLRIDLDRVVLQGVIPDMAMARTGEEETHRLTVRTMATLTAEWEELRIFWSGKTLIPRPPHEP